MNQRVKQLFWAFSAHKAKIDWNWVGEQLSSTELELFMKMDPVTRYHAFRVAQTALKLIESSPPSIDKGLLLKGALLHDMGKEQGDISVWDRVLFVAANTLFPRLSGRFAKAGQGSFLQNLRHGFYVHFEHPQKGARLAGRANLSPDLIKLIEDHHLPAKPDDPVELTILRQADEAN